MEYAVESDQLSKNYGSVKALSSVSMHVPRGEIYGFVGRNGAGKTTCLRVLTGLQKPSEGSYQLFGVDYRNRREIRHQRNRIGAIIDSAAMYQDLGALENLRLQLLMMGVPDKSEAEYLLGLVGLSQAGKRPVRTYSLGMKQRLGIAMALAGSPDLLILDEPVNGLDPQGIIELRELIDRLRMQEGITFLISSHYLDELARLATWFGFLNHGKLIREVSREKMEQDCRHKMILTVSNRQAFLRVMEERKIPYQLLDGDEAEIYQDIPVTELVLMLNKVGCNVRRITEQAESLESYYISLVGGNGDE